MEQILHHKNWCPYSMQSKKYLCFALFTIVFLWLAITCFLPEKSIYKTARTVGLIKQCEILESCKLDLGLKPSEFIYYLRSNEADGFSLGQIFSAMNACPTCIPKRIIEITNVEGITDIKNVTDSWGNPLNFIWKSNAITNKIPKELANKTLPVLIWSSGPNGSNELGHGDDIYVGKSISNASQKE